MNAYHSIYHHKDWHNQQEVMDSYKVALGAHTFKKEKRFDSLKKAHQLHKHGGLEDHLNDNFKHNPVFCHENDHNHEHHTHPIDHHLHDMHDHFKQQTHELQTHMQMQKTICDPGQLHEI
tara:strand:- start:78 stop:437 length:360 start_codon:yes stop_codon:yes gene_type:complete